MLEQLGTIHPLLSVGAGLLALLAGAVIINLVAKQVLVRGRIARRRIRSVV